MLVSGVLIDAARCFSVTEEKSTNKCTYASLFFFLKHREPKSSKDKLSIGTVAFVNVLWDNL